MEIVHFAPYAPAAAGIYEAARDMVRADTMRGHLVSFVDVGATLVNGIQQPAQVGAVDDRGGFKLVTMPPEWANTADLLIFHTGVNDNWVVKNQAPIVVILHGRPAASFRMEQRGAVHQSYSLIGEFAKWPRVKRFVTFWPEHVPYWRVLIPKEKLVALDYPPIDLLRFSPDGPRHEFPPELHGKWNALICDSWRDDIDCFEIANGAIEAARCIKGLKVHFWAMETQPGTTNLFRCWEWVVGELRHLGALGELHGREPGMDAVYRAMDLVMTPHRIVTRITGEALACGIPVLGAQGCRATSWTVDIQEPKEVARVAAALVDSLKFDRVGMRQRCLEMAQEFSLERYGQAIEQIYQEAVKR